MSSYTLLTRGEAFSAGAAFWILAEPVASDAGALLDWRLGFQIARASARPRPVLCHALLKVAAQSDYGPPLVEVPDDAPLMIEASGRLPCRAAIVISFTKDVTQWARSCRHQWEKLGQPTMRVFLPRGAAAPVFQAQWVANKASDANVDSSEPLQIIIDAEFASSAHRM